MEHGELIVAVDLPTTPFAARSHYLKVRDRASYAFAMTSVATALELQNGVVRSVRLALGGVGTKPWRAYEAEKNAAEQAVESGHFASGSQRSRSGRETANVQRLQSGANQAHGNKSVGNCGRYGMNGSELGQSQGVVGKPLNRVDGHLKVTGGARYSAEFPVAKLVHGVTIQSTIASGKIAQMDTRAAEQVPGVLLVMTHLNAPKVSGEAGGERKLPLLQDNTVRYSGQHIGVVVADTLEHAIQAAALVKIQYDEAKPALHLQENLDKAYMPQGKIPRNEPPDSAHGNVEQGLASAAVKVEQTYTTPIENHNPMEPHATTAVWQGDRLLLYDATQGVFGAKKKVAAVLGMPPENVRTMSYFVGGGFGCKGSVWAHVVLAAMAARQVKRPVKLVLERTQMFGPVGFRPETLQQVALGANP